MTEPKCPKCGAPMRTPFGETYFMPHFIDDIDCSARQLAAAEARVAELEKFKAYVHKRLDDAGVPVDPDSPHKAAGCRIGGRLDVVLDRYAALLAKLKNFQSSLESRGVYDPRAGVDALQLAAIIQEDGQ